MKKSLIVLVVLLLSSITSQVYCSEYICEEAAKGLTETTVTFSQYFDSLKNWSVRGVAKIRDIYPVRGDSNEYKLLLDCGNDVLLNTKSRSAGLRDLKIGQEVKFSSSLLGWNKQFYVNSNKSYIEIKMGDSTISY